MTAMDDNNTTDSNSANSTSRNSNDVTQDHLECSLPGTSEFVNLIVQNHTEAVYTCYKNYNHRTGNLTRYCQPDGTWSGSVPHCTREKAVSETTIAFITGALAFMVLILLPIDYILSKRRIRRQKLWERRATKKRRNERVAAFNLIAIKHAQNLDRPPLILLKARDKAMNPIPVGAGMSRFNLYNDDVDAEETMNGNTAEYQTINEEIQNKNYLKNGPKEEHDISTETEYIENEMVNNPRTLPPLEKQPSVRKKKKKRKRRITPQSSFDVDDGGFVNSAYSNSNSHLDAFPLEQNPQSSSPTFNSYETRNEDINTPKANGSVHQHFVTVHRVDEDVTNPSDTTYNANAYSSPARTVQDRGPLPPLPDSVDSNGGGPHDNIAVQVGYNNLGKLATDV